MKFSKTIGIILPIFVLIAAGIVAWQSRVAEELHSRVYRVGFGDDPPFQFRAADGTPTGVAVEIVKEAARRRGIHLQWIEPAHYSASAIEHGDTDLWVLMTDLPQRHSTMYISEPYLTMERCFLVLKGSGLRSSSDLAKAKIAYRQSWVNGPAAGVSSNADQLYLRSHFPTATAIPVPMEQAGSLVQALRDHTVDAGLVNKTVMPAQLVSERQREDLDLINAPDAIGPLGLGASFSAKRAAQSIRGEIDTMAEDGSMGRITEPWGFFQTASLNIVGQLADVKRTNRMLAEGVAGLTIALFSIAFLAELVRRQRNSMRVLSARLISAQEQERTRIARDLHDDISQQLVTIGMSLSRFKRSSPAPEPSGAADWQGLQGQVERVRSGVHRISHALHPALLEFSGLLAALDALRRDIAAASGIPVSFDPGPLADAGGEPLPAETALCLYRVAQEALQNAVKHSGSPELHIRLARNRKDLELSVSDSGRGIRRSAMEGEAGLGLVSMRERARLMNGHLRIESHTDGPHRGTTVMISIPIPQPAHTGNGPSLTDRPPERVPVPLANSGH